jgi:hypothetical protein
MLNCNTTFEKLIVKRRVRSEIGGSSEGRDLLVLKLYII